MFTLVNYENFRIETASSSRGQLIQYGSLSDKFWLAKLTVLNQLFVREFEVVALCTKKGPSKSMTAIAQPSVLEENVEQEETWRVRDGESLVTKNP